MLITTLTRALVTTQGDDVSDLPKDAPQLCCVPHETLRPLVRF